jgi:hypothetical protein
VAGATALGVSAENVSTVGTKARLAEGQGMFFCGAIGAREHLANSPCFFGKSAEPCGIWISPCFFGSATADPCCLMKVARWFLALSKTNTLFNISELFKTNEKWAGSLTLES